MRSSDGIATTASPCSIVIICAGHGSAYSGLPFPTCTFGFAPWVSGRTGESFNAGVPEIEHDVLVIGAGGAGLRAAIEASAAGVTVGLVCKSLLGKAHTVMAEGGI